MATQQSSAESESSHREGVQSLADECQSLWQELQEVQEKVSHSGRTLDSKEPLTDIYRHKEKLLKAHIETLKEHRLKGSSVEVSDVKGKVEFISHDQ